MWILYRLATLLLGPAWLLFLKVRHGGRLGERLGFLSRRSDRPVWIQGVSVGEVRIALRLASALRERGIPVLLSATTQTGLALAEAHGESPVPFPADLPGVAARAFRRLGPRLVILVETELWPGFLRAAAGTNLPVAVVNARLSDRSLGRTLRFAGAFGSSLRSLFVAAQSAVHGQRFQELGVPGERIAITGNLKYDLNLPPRFEPVRKELWALCGGAGFAWVAGSVREGEESLVLEAQRRIREALPSARCLLAPRHMNRVGICLEEARRAGLLPQKRSLAAAGEAWDVLILDSMGELQSAYACGQVAFVGGSLVPLGGQNMLEPAALSIPVLFGPSTENFREEAARLLEGGGALRISGAEDLSERVVALLQNREGAEAMGAKARASVAEYRGALENTLGFLTPLVGDR